jgi:hypothetical protein
MNIKELIQQQFPNSKHADSIKSSKLLDDRFIYTELNSGASVFYEIREGRLYIYKRHEVTNREDNERWIQIFRESKLNDLLEE